MLLPHSVHSRLSAAQQLPCNPGSVCALHRQHSFPHLLGTASSSSRTPSLSGLQADSAWPSKTHGMLASHTHMHTYTQASRSSSRRTRLARPWQCWTPSWETSSRRSWTSPASASERAAAAAAALRLWPHHTRTALVYVWSPSRQKRAARVYFWSPSHSALVGPRSRHAGSLCKLWQLSGLMR